MAEDSPFHDTLIFVAVSGPEKSIICNSSPNHRFSRSSLLRGHALRRALRETSIPRMTEALTIARAPLNNQTYSRARCGDVPTSM